MEDVAVLKGFREADAKRHERKPNVMRGSQTS